MERLSEVLIVTGLILLRLGGPLAVMLLLGHWLRRYLPDGTAEAAKGGIVGRPNPPTS